MTSANGNLDFFKSECVVGTAFSVDRTYFGGQLASGDGVTLVCGCQYMHTEETMKILRLEEVSQEVEDTLTQQH